MAGNTVTLTFVGDSRNLEGTIDKVKKSTSSINKTVSKAGLAFGGLGAAASAGSLAVAGSLALVPLAFAAIGVAALKDNEEIKKSFDEMGKSIKTTLAESAKPLVGTFQSITDKVNASLKGIAPQLTGIFTAIGPQLDTLTGGVLRFVENAMPGFTEAIKAADPVIKAISEGLAGTGTAISQFFQNISGGSGGAADGVTKLFDSINFLIPVVGTVIGFLAEWSGFLVPLGIGIGIVVGIVKAAALAQTLWNAALALNPIGAVIIVIGLLIGAFIYLWNNVEGFRNFFIGVWDAIKSAAGTAKDWIVEKFNAVVSFFTSAKDKIGGIFSAIGSAISAPFRAAFEGIRSLWNNTVGRISFTIPSWVPVVGGKGFSMPKFHTGGVVPGAPGSEMMAILQAGERVIPANKSGGGGTEIRFTGNTTDALATVIQQMIRTGKIQVA